MDANEFRERSREIWDSMAEGWERQRGKVGDMSRDVADWLVENLDPQPGQTVLELAGGPGGPGFAAAAILGDEGKLISTDFAPAMVEAATRRGRQLGLANVEYKVMDAERMPLADDSVDGVLCRWGYMLMADPLAAFRETRRVLRQGGNLSFACFSGPQHNPWASIAGKVLTERGHMTPPPPEAPGIFSLAESDRVASLLEEAGFQTPRFEEVPFRFQFDSTDDYMFFLTEMAGAISPIIKALEREEREKVRDDIELEEASFQTGNGFHLPALSLNAVTR